MRIYISLPLKIFDENSSAISENTIFKVKLENQKKVVSFAQKLLVLLLLLNSVVEWKKALLFLVWYWFGLNKKLIFQIAISV